MKLSNRQQVEQFVKEARTQSDAVRDRLARKAALGHCYYVGKHWVNEKWLGRDWQTFRDHASAAAAREPDRVAKNICDRHLIKIAAASFPVRIEPQVRTSYRDYSPYGAFVAQCNEDLASLMVERSGLVYRARNAVMRRTLSGQHLIGLQLRRRASSIVVDGAEERVADTELRAFDAGMYRMSLDPGNESIDLHDHEWAVYSDVWTETRIRRELGVTLKPEQLRPLGELTPTEQAAWFHSEGRAFAGYRQHSKSPAAIVHQVFVKGSHDRFDQFFVMIEPTEGDMAMVGEDDENPYGGNGLPFVRLNGYIPGEGAICLSDFDLLKQHQDSLNLFHTQKMRLGRKNAGTQWLVDKQAYPNTSGAGEIRSQYTNDPFGIVLYDSRGNRKANPPQAAQMPSPPPFFDNVVAEMETTMMESSFRPGSFHGEVKSHVADAVVRRTMEAAGDVFGQRNVQDQDAYRRICQVLLGTAIRLVQERSVGTIVALGDAGFGPDEFAAIAGQDYRNPVGELTVREGAARFQSPTAKREALDSAMSIQAIDPMDYRIAILNDLDTPLAERDRAAKAFAQKAVLDILNGQPFEPMPLSPTSHGILLAEFETAMLDPKMPIEGRRAIGQAAMLQQQMMAPPPEAGMGDPAQPEPSAMDMASPADLLGQTLGSQL